FHVTGVQTCALPIYDILLLSSLMQQNGNEAGAFAVLEKGLVIFPENPYLLNNISRYYSRNGRAEEAFALLQRVNGNKTVVTANKIALQAKHLVHYDEVYE